MLIYYDLETTGLNQFHDGITEFCFIKEKNGYNKYTSLLNPGKRITEYITKITGITNEMVQDKPHFGNIKEDIINFISNRNGETSYLVAHNNDGFDRLILKEHLKKEGIRIENYNIKFIDTLLFAKKLFPQYYKFNLSTLCDRLGVQKETAHRAEGDTKMLRGLYLKLCEELSKQTTFSKEEIINNPEYVMEYIYG